ncbi:MAG: 50S ribosomal protein L31 [Chloroflexi bacterium]|nr:50S ribosomal protein L31 [Chloroflexota bacterium]
MKESIHPEWHPQATVVCACGNTWNIGATVPEIRTDICSACHPFYTGEQRIVDTEGQVDRFMKRLQVRDQKLAEAEAAQAAKTPLDLPIASLGLNKRYANMLAENGLATAGDFIAKLEANEEEALLEIPGIGRKVIADLKKLLRARGYELPKAEAAE